jgi:hypothetical protein
VKGLTLLSGPVLAGRACTELVAMRAMSGTAAKNFIVAGLVCKSSKRMCRVETMSESMRGCCRLYLLLLIAHVLIVPGLISGTSMEVV